MVSVRTVQSKRVSVDGRSVKAVVLCAGRGTRMKPLTDDTPKPLLPVAGKPIVEHNIELLRELVDEIVIVSGYRREQFYARYGDDEDIAIVEQTKPKGTAHAALQARDEVKDDFLILNGDDIYGEGLQRMLERDRAVLASKVENPTEYGVFRTDSNRATGVVEKPDDPPSEMANTGCYRAESGFFDLLEEVEESERGELEITDALQSYIDGNDVELVEAERWLPCSYPWQLIEANEALLEDLERRVEGEIHDSATIEGSVIVEDGAEVGSNALVKGPAVMKSGAEIGHGSRVRSGTVLMEDSKVGLASEAKNTVLRREAKLPHLSYAGDSYIGRGANFGAGAVAANLRHDEDSVGIEVKGEILDSGRRKLGAVVGSNAKIGVNASIQPGRKVGREAAVKPGEVVKNNRDSERTTRVGIDFDRVLFDTDGFADALKEEFSFKEKTDAHYPGGLYDIRAHAESSGVDPEKVIEFAESTIRDFTFDGLHHFEELDAFVVTRGLRWWQELKVRNSGVLDYVDGFVVVDHPDIGERDKQVGDIDLLVDDTEDELEAVGCETFHYDHTQHTPRDIVEKASDLE